MDALLANMAAGAVVFGSSAWPQQLPTGRRSPPPFKDVSMTHLECISGITTKGIASASGGATDEGAVAREQHAHTSSSDQLWPTKQHSQAGAATKALAPASVECEQPEQKAWYRRRPSWVRKLAKTDTDEHEDAGLQLAPTPTSVASS
eukprot:TRINITY_DN9667_c0_g1_i1.p2 TRINITY_DN9667_c0_g1~~TRINITY_DN9667_c0_g1_i1.p2  ORF type:complete len:148 (-),score=33.43 TRINITY_DN9667_c0_g1_i1:560-1003(-)